MTVSRASFRAAAVPYAVAVLSNGLALTLTWLLWPVLNLNPNSIVRQPATGPSASQRILAA